MQFDSLNFGKKYYARYDRRNDISVVTTYKLNNNITISGTWVYGTGNAVTLPQTEYITSPHQIGDNDQYSQYNFYNGQRLSMYEQIVNDFGEKNNFRMKSYHRLDIGIQFHKEKKWGERIWEISVYNAYNRKNPFYYYTDYNFDKDTGKEYGLLKQVSLFPIIPSFTYSFKF